MTLRKQPSVSKRLIEKNLTNAIAYLIWLIDLMKPIQQKQFFTASTLHLISLKGVGEDGG